MLFIQTSKRACDAVNDDPTGSPTATLPTGSEDTVYTISVATLLQGFSDVDGDALAVIDLTATPAGISLVDEGSGTFAYTPDDNFWGSVTLGYSVTDGQGGTIKGVISSFSIASGAVCIPCPWSIYLPIYLSTDLAAAAGV